MSAAPAICSRVGPGAGSAAAASFCGRRGERLRHDGGDVDAELAGRLGDALADGRQPRRVGRALRRQFDPAVERAAHVAGLSARQRQIIAGAGVVGIGLEHRFEGAGGFFRHHALVGGDHRLGIGGQDAGLLALADADGVAVGLDAVVETAHAGVGLRHQQPALKVVRLVLQVLFQLGDGLHHLGRRTAVRLCFT